MTQNSSIPQDPRDPYTSSLVSASAGSGKTFQLSRRFLALVTAGANPSSILAVTFSKKAAGEMRERIIKDAIRYGNQHPEFAGFYDEISAWRQAAISRGMQLPALLKPREVGALISGHTQSLSITTIDSVLMEWCRKFPWETQLERSGTILAQPWDIASKKEQDQFVKLAWSKALAAILSTQSDDPSRQELLQQLFAASPEEQLTVAWTRMENLRHSETFIWLCEHLRGEASLPLVESFTPNLPRNDEDLLTLLYDDLSAVIDKISNPDKKILAFHGLHTRDFQPIIQAGVLTQSRKLHGVTVSKKIRSELPEQVERIDRTCTVYFDQQRISKLNAHAQMLWHFYRAWSSSYHDIKAKTARGSFSDALKGVWQLFHEGHPGARWLIHNNVRHMMLDEFQDTSRLQWNAFSVLAKDILAGKTMDNDSIPGTVFVVGDAKQSIYGFREAAPEIVQIAHEELMAHGFHKITMSTSWRTSSIVLDVVNQLFSQNDFIADFPPHTTALVGGAPVIANIGSVVALNTPIIDEMMAETDKPHVRLEAEQVARHIRDCLDGTIPCPVWDKDLREWRQAKAHDFALLYHTKTDAEFFENALRIMHIPAMREEREGFYERQEVRDVLTLLRWLAWPTDTVALCSLLRSPAFDFSDAELQKLIAVDQPTSISLLNELKVTHPLVAERLIEAQRIATTQPPYAMILWWYRATNAIPRYERFFGALEGQLASANLLKLAELVRAAESAGHGHLQAVISHLAEQASEDDTGNATITSNAVRLLTIHKSKGLEFPVVIIVGLANDWFRSDKYWLRSIKTGREGLSYIGTSVDQPLEDQDFAKILQENESQVRAEKSRLLYVALTRAQYHLILTSGYRATKNRPNPPADSFYTKLVEAIRRAGGTSTEQNTRLERLPEFEVAPRKGPIREELDSRRDSFLRVPNSSRPDRPLPPLTILTATAQANLALRQEEFNVSEQIAEVSIIVDDPASRSPEAAVLYGIVVHRILELALNGTSWTEAQLLAWLKRKESLATRHKLSEQDAHKLVRVAVTDTEILLKTSIWQELTSDVAEFFLEAPFVYIKPSKNRSTAKTLISGQPDLVLRKTDGSWWIVDYKTSLIPSHTNDLNFCRERGYDVQIASYLDALKTLNPGATIKSGILFTRHGLLLELPPT